LKKKKKKKKKKKNGLFDTPMFFICFYIVMQNGNLERRVEETVLSDKFPCRQVRIPATLRHSRNFSSFPRKRESRTSKFSDGF
ncbi:hypothetical protein, partial [Neisseria polysaccharea]|uniref:hypothetical protein n=1 Tax=Neisseria polysaccharea TaxID=489 RepID=UPI0027DF2CAC